MLVQTILIQLLLAVIGLSAGTAVASGLFSFVVELGVVADFADRTHTADQLLRYEDSVALGGIFGNLFLLFRPWVAKGILMVLAGQPLTGQILLLGFGLFAGIFVGCWAMALAEILNVFPMFIRRARIVRFTAAFIISVAIGKGLGAGIFFALGFD